MKLDYTLQTAKERVKFVEELLKDANAKQEQLTSRYLKILSDYIIDAYSTKEQKTNGLLSDNRMVTINKRETSFEGLIEKFENNEDGIYNLFSEEDKNIILTPKIKITPKDIAEVPGLADLVQSIKQQEEKIKRAKGRDRFLMMQSLIDMRREQYLLKNSFRQPVGVSPTPTLPAKINLSGKRWVNQLGEPESDELINFFNEKHISSLLLFYPTLAEYTKGRNDDDFLYLIKDFYALVLRALSSEYPQYLDIVKMKWAGKTNAEIQQMLQDKYNNKHTVEYISALWRNKIPKLITQQAKEDYLIWHYNYEDPKGAKWKKCSKCQQIKLAHPYFFSKNNTSKSGFYSICKKCRNKKGAKI